MGEYDFVPELLEKLSVKKIFYKVRVKPGNPVSVQVAYKLFAESL